MKYTIDLNLIYHLIGLVVVIATALGIYRIGCRIFDSIRWNIRRRHRVERDIEEIRRVIHGEEYPFDTRPNKCVYDRLDAIEKELKSNKQPVKYKTRKS